MDHPNFWYGMGRALCFDLWYGLWAELYVSTSGMGLGRALCLNFWYGLGPSFMSQLLVWVWTELNLPLSQKGMGYPFYGPISYLNFPTSNCPSNLYSLFWRERFDWNGGEICITIQSFERNAVGNSMVGHSIREYGSVHYYRLRMRTSRSVLWVENSVTNSGKSEPERCVQ